MNHFVCQQLLITIIIAILQSEAIKINHLLLLLLLLLWLPNILKIVHTCHAS
jgi:hypothetical protein